MKVLERDAMPTPQLGKQRGKCIKKLRLLNVLSVWNLPESLKFLKGIHYSKLFAE